MISKKKPLESNSGIKIRLFIAFHIDRNDKITITRISDEFKRRYPDKPTQWILKENLHVTLQFLGNVTRFKGKALMEKIKNHSHIKKPFSLETKKLIVLPNKDYPKVLALSIKKTKPLMELAALTDQLATALNIKLSAHPYLPHLTLGYLKEDADISDIMNTSIEKITLHPKKIVLFQSAASLSAKYTPIQSIIF